MASLSLWLQNPVKKKFQTDEKGVPADRGSGQASQLSETHCNLMEVWSNVILDICPKIPTSFCNYFKSFLIFLFSSRVRYIRYQGIKYFNAQILLKIIKVEMCNKKLLILLSQHFFKKKSFNNTFLTSKLVNISEEYIYCNKCHNCMSKE